LKVTQQDETAFANAEICFLLLQRCSTQAEVASRASIFYLAVLAQQPTQNEQRGHLQA
jgi:hypothetical protein